MKELIDRKGLVTGFILILISLFLSKYSNLFWVVIVVVIIAILLLWIWESRQNSPPIQISEAKQTPDFDNTPLTDDEIFVLEAILQEGAECNIQNLSAKLPNRVFGYGKFQLLAKHLEKKGLIEKTKKSNVEISPHGYKQLKAQDKNS
ncbi:MAG: hypothetical protein ACQEQL_02515 [Pseudomonadota bacterium]